MMNLPFSALGPSDKDFSDFTSNATSSTKASSGTAATRDANGAANDSDSFEKTLQAAVNPQATQQGQQQAQAQAAMQAQAQETAHATAANPTTATTAHPTGMAALAANGAKQIGMHAANVQQGQTGAKAVAPIGAPAPKYLRVADAVKLPGITTPQTHTASHRSTTVAAPKPDSQQKIDAAKLEAAKRTAGQPPEQKDDKELAVTNALAQAGAKLDPSATAPMNAPALVAAPPPVMPASAMIPLSDDALVRANLSQHQARLLVDTGDAGSMSLHLKVRNGTTELRVDGPAAHLLSTQVPEMRRVLAMQGISLGNVDVGARDSSSSNSQNPSGDSDGRAERGTGPASSTSAVSSTASTSKGPRVSRGAVDIEA